MSRLLSTTSAIALASTVWVPALAQDDAPAQRGRIETITVTATKQEAAAQDIPVAVQAVDSETIDELNIGNFDDYVRYLPNVTAGGRGPGQSTIFIRGLSVEPITVMLSGAQGSTPNVALYLDEQPVTAPGRNLDVYATDLERIEVLAGPQGTLYGASSQAGTVRLITNKPVLDEFQAGFDASVAFTQGGEMSDGVEAYINVPIIEDKFGVRAAFYSINEGGYIDNVEGSFTLDPAVNPLSNGPAGAARYDTASNIDLVEDDFNDSFYKGVRLSAKYQVTDDWSVLVQHTQQELGADGVFDYDPEVGDLEVSRFFPDKLRDEFGQTSWTIEGRLAMLDLLYTGAYLDRDVNQSIDYTGYNNVGGFIAYYTCTYTNPDYIVNYGIDPQFITPDGRECLNPVKGFKGEQFHTRNTHEFRFSTDQTNRWRLTAGVFYDDFEIETLDDYAYLAVPDLGFAPNAPLSTATSINPSTRPEGIAFFNDITRTEKQIAVFGEVSFDLIPDLLTVTAGARYYDLEQDFTGSSNFADGIFQGSVNQDRGRDYDLSGGHSDKPLELDGVIQKYTVTYTPTQDLLFYATYSEGYRPGGFNRGGGIPSANPAFPTVGVTYDTDDVTNYEAGWKTLLMDGNLQFNGNVYFIEWTDMQVSRFDPQNVSILTFIENAADSEILGVEADTVWSVNENLTLFAALSYNDTELTETRGQAVELVPVGSSLPLTPEFQGNLRGRYEQPFAGDYVGFVQAGVQYADSTTSSLVAADSREQDSYVTADLSFGVTQENWSAEIFIENLTDERAELFINDQDDIVRIATNRPRTVGLRVSYDYY